MKQQTQIQLIQDVFPIKLTDLKIVSDENYGVLNRSIDVDAFSKANPTKKTVICHAHIEHNHAFGRETKRHYRLIINGYLTQDVWPEQLTKLKFLSLIEQDLK